MRLASCRRLLPPTPDGLCWHSAWPLATARFCDGGDSLGVLVAHRGVKDLAQDVDHVSEVRLVSHEGQPHVTDPDKRIGSEGEWVHHMRESPVDKISGVG